MKKVRIVQIGINEHSHGRDVFNTLKKLSDEFELVGYVLVEDEKEKFAHILSVFDGYQELSLEQVWQDESIDAVAIETEEIHLTKYAILSAQHNKHIHMEKPGGTDLPNFERLIDAVKKHQKTFHLGYMYRYNPAVIDLLEKVKKGELGEIISVQGSMDCRHSLRLRKWLRTFDGGITFFLGCHIIDLILADVNKRLADKELVIRLTKEAEAFIVDSAYDPIYGARPLKRFMQKTVETLAARLILCDGVSAGDTIVVDVENGVLKARRED